MTKRTAGSSRLSCTSTRPREAVELGLRLVLPLREREELALPALLLLPLELALDRGLALPLPALLPLGLLLG